MKSFPGGKEFNVHAQLSSGAMSDMHLRRLTHVFPGCLIAK